MTGNGSASDKLVRKVRALLDQAEDRGVTPEESEAFYAKAAQLIAQHSISDARLRAAGKAERDEIVEVRIDLGSTYHQAWRIAGAKLGYAFGFKVMIGKSGKNGWLLWIGWKTEVEPAQILWASLNMQAARAALQHMESCSYLTHREDRFKEKRSFILGFGNKVAERVRLNRELARKTAGDEDTSGTLLPALVDKDGQLDRYYDDIPKGRASASRVGVTASGWHSGQAAGNRADIGSAQVGGRKAIEG